MQQQNVNFKNIQLKFFDYQKTLITFFSFFQMNEIYNGLDYQLKKLIRSFEKQIFMLKAFLQELNLVKHL